MSSSLIRAKTKGFGLLEVILVFAIVIGAAAVVFSVFQSAKPSADASNEASNLTTIAANLKSTFGMNNSYVGLTRPLAIQAKAIPTSMIKNGTAIATTWGAVGVAAASAIPGTPCAQAGRCFDLRYTAVPTDTCAKLIQGVAGYFDDVQINSVSLFTNGQVDSSKVVSNCAGTASAPVNIDFMGH